ncbi:MAG TPA: LLM class flavin-dependent oxidoreductase [Candidatus Lustribacter sp.]|jgi:alkanesulfonate monooxygenase SsuD/methylene tetrahydromethanopterin reductase-like flavin-dependent oxidoreductase (luciferase family)|nr:LLM class flavin-dependent oxidoreductase [Candidatus Lustribacter sp.]
MKFGAFDHLDRGLSPTSQHYEDRLRMIEAYEDSGWFHAFHMTEHHGTPLVMAPCPSVFLAAVAQRTTTLRFGTLVYTLAAYHPYRFFEEICMLDQMSWGRLELGIGRGVSPIELSFLGVDIKDADEMYAESLEVLMRCFEGGTLNFQGKHYQFEDTPIVMETFQKPHPPLWYGIGSPDRTVWAAKHSVNVMTAQKAPEARIIHDRYKLEWAKAGRDPAEFPFCGTAKHMVIADTDAEAIALAKSAYAMYTNHTTLLWRQRGIPRLRAWTDDFDEARAGGLIFAGSPTTVRDGLANFIEESGANYLACRVAFGDLTFEQSMHSLELLTDKIFPDLADLVPA